MRETFWYREYTQEELDALLEEARLNSAVGVEWQAPAAYQGQILEYDDGGADGSRLTNPTPIDQTPTDAGFVDIDLVFGVISEDKSTMFNVEGGILRIEQHPSMYGRQFNLIFNCELSNGSVPTNNSIINAIPKIVAGQLVIEIALILSPDSIITQENLINKLDNLTYGGDNIIISSIQSETNAPIIAFKNLDAYNTSGDLFHDLCEEPKTYLTTLGNPDAQLPSGLPYIEGRFEQGELLAVGIADITDRDTVFPINFQWYREENSNGIYINSPILNANSIFYITTASDVTKNLTVVVSYINKAGDAVQVSSPPVYIFNSISKGTISISAESFRVGSEITAQVGTISDKNGIKSIGNYRWQRSNKVPLVSSSPWTPEWIDIQDSSDEVYQISEDDQQRRIRFAVDVTDNLDEVKTLTSEQTTVINTSPQGTLEILGLPTIGSELAANKNFAEPDVYNWQTKSRTYTWYRNGIEIPNSSKTGNDFTQNVNKYTIQAEDYGSQISVSVTYVDDLEYEEVIVSEAVSVIGSTASGLSISGNNYVNGTISADFTNFIDPDITSERLYTDSDGNTKVAQIGKPIPTQVLYRWQKVSDQTYLTTESNQNKNLLVESSYYGEDIRLIVKYPDELNEGTFKVSTAEIDIVNSEPTGEIVLTGSVVGVRLPLTLSVDQIRDNDQPSNATENSEWDFNYQLSVRQRNDFGNLQAAVNIANGSGVMKGNQTVVYTVSPEYQNSVIIATVTYTDGAGIQHSLEDSIEIPSVGYPTIDGVLEQGQTLTLNTSEIENLISITSIKWYVLEDEVFEEILGATEETYEVSLNDVEKYVKVEIEYVTNSSDSETRSAVPVLIENSKPVGTPRIENSGSFYAQGFAVGDVLSSSVSHITDINGIQEIYDYQWYVQTNAHYYTTPSYQEDRTNLENVSGETSTTYTIRESDQGKRIGYKIKLRDSLDKIHELNSGLSWRRVDIEPTGFVKIKRTTDGNETTAGISDELSVDFSNVLDLDGISENSYIIWKADDVVVKQGNVGTYGTSMNYVVRPQDYGKSITLVMSYNDRVNSDRREFTSVNSIEISATAASGLYISGEVLPGNEIEADLTHLDEPDGLPNSEEIQYQWYRDNVSIENETLKTYQVLRSDYGKVLKVVINYIDNQSNPETLEAAVLVGDSEPQGYIKLSSDFKLGSNITIDVSNITDVYGPETEQENSETEFSYVLTRIKSDLTEEIISQNDIYGNETGTYTIVQQDLGCVFSIQASFLDGKGDFKTITGTILFDQDGNEIIISNGQSGQKRFSFIIEVPAEESENIDDTSNTIIESTYQGPIVATGAGVKTVKLLSNNYIVVYGSNGYNPNIQNYTISATAYNHIAPIYYKFYRLTNGNDSLIIKGANDTDASRKINTPINYFSTITYRVDTIEGSENGEVVASDLVIIYGIKE